MQSYNNVAHHNIRNLLVKRNFPDVPGGLCFGVLFSAIRFFLRDNHLDKFSELTGFIAREGDSIDSLITKVLTSRVNKLKEPCLSRYTLFSEKIENMVFHVLSLLDMVAIFSMSYEYADLFDARIGHNNPELIYPHTFPCEPNSSEKLAFLDEWTGVYSALDLKLLFYTINNSINEVGKSKLVAPFVMTFSGVYNNELHVIGICFEPTSKTWYLIDANQLPIIECDKSISLVNINKFINFFSTAFSCPSRFLLRTKIYSSEKNADNILEVISKLRYSPQFKQIHTINPDKLSYCDRLGNSWLHFACENENAEVIAGLLQSGSEINKTNSDGFTPLMIAAILGNQNAVASLLLHHADVNYAHENGVTALFLAAQTGHYDIVKMLLDANADKNRSLLTGNMDALYKYTKGTESEKYMRLFVLMKYQEKRESGDYDAKISVSPYEISVVMQHEDIAKLLSGFEAGLEKSSRNSLK